MSSTPSKQTSSVPIPTSRFGLKGFFNEVGREIRKINWPSVKETNRLSGIVLSICFGIGILLYALSSVADLTVRFLLGGRS